MEFFIGVAIGSIILLGVHSCEKKWDDAIASRVAMNNKCEKLCYPNLGMWTQYDECICDSRFKKSLEETK